MERLRTRPVQRSIDGREGQREQVLLIRQTQSTCRDKYERYARVRYSAGQVGRDTNGVAVRDEERKKKR